MPRPSLGRQCFHCSTGIGPRANLGRPDEAEPLLREALEIAQGNDRSVTACIPALTRLGWHLAQVGRFDEAEPPLVSPVGTEGEMRAGRASAGGEAAPERAPLSHAAFSTADVCSFMCRSRWQSSRRMPRSISTRSAMSS